MRWHGSWMEDIDERILEALDDADDPMSAWQLAFDLETPTQRRARERCRVLARAGFTVVLPRRPHREQYDITGWGQQYLLGEIDADHRRPVPAPRPPEAVRPDWYAGFG